MLKQRLKNAAGIYCIPAASCSHGLGLKKVFVIFSTSQRIAKYVTVNDFVIIASTRKTTHSPFVKAVVYLQPFEIGYLIILGLLEIILPYLIIK